MHTLFACNFLKSNAAFQSSGIHFTVQRLFTLGSVFDDRNHNSAVYCFDILMLTAIEKQFLRFLITKYCDVVNDLDFNLDSTNFRFSEMPAFLSLSYSLSMALRTIKCS